MPEATQNTTEEEVIKFAKSWAKFRFSIAESNIDAVEVSIKAYNEIGTKEVFGKSVGTYFVPLEIPKVVPIILLEIFNGKHLSIEAIYYEQKK